MKKEFIKKQGGFTLLELLITVGIAAILLGIGIPSTRDFIVSTRLTANVNEIVRAMQITRSEAVKRSTRVTVCPSTNGQSCNANNDWTKGWVIFVDKNQGVNINSEDVIQFHGPLNMNQIEYSNEYKTQYLTYIADGSPISYAGQATEIRINLRNHIHSEVLRRVSSRSGTFVHVYSEN